MKVTAYIADCCGELKSEDDVFGLSLQPDLIDKFESFKTISNPEKATAHYCVRCYNKYVIEVVHLIVNGNKNDPDYSYYMKVHAHSFKQMVVNKFNGRK